MLLNWILTITTFLLGYYLGSKRSIKDDFATLQKSVRKAVEKDDIGPIRRPSAEKLYKMANPHIAAEEEAMRKTLEKTMG